MARFGSLAQSSSADPTEHSHRAAPATLPPDMSAFSNATKAHIARGVGRLTDLVFARGRGSYVETTCGRKFLDFTTGIGVVSRRGRDVAFCLDVTQ